MNFRSDFFNRNTILIAVFGLLTLFGYACETEEEFYVSDEEEEAIELIQVYMDEWMDGMVVWAEVRGRDVYHQEDIYLGQIGELIIFEDNQYYFGDQFEKWKGGYIEEPDSIDLERVFPASAGMGTSNGTRDLWPVVNDIACDPQGQNAVDCVWIDYTIKPNCNYAQGETICQGISRWEKYTDNYIHFENYTYGNWGGPAGASRIEFDCNASKSCSANLGRRKDITNKVWSAECGDNSMVHEIGHALGMFHEHTRHDRDAWLDVHFDNIGNGKEYNYYKYETWYPNADGKDLGPYDFDSIMHYRSCSKVKKPGIPMDTCETHCEEYFDCTEDALYDPNLTNEDCAALWEHYTGPAFNYDWEGPPYDFTEVMRSGDRNRLLVTEGDEFYPNYMWFRHEMSNDLYGIGRLYSDAWYLSGGGLGDFRVHNWHPEEGAGLKLDPEHFVVGKFCDDEELPNLSRVNNDDILWYVDDATDPWYFICDGGYPYWHYKDVGFSEEVIDQFHNLDLNSDGFKNILVGDFDGAAFDNESFDDILINDPTQNSYEWYIWRNGQQNTDSWGGGPWNTHGYSDLVSTLGVGHFCEEVESASDVVRKNPDADQWQVSCDATGLWQDIALTIGEMPRDVALYDFDGDGRTDILRNNEYTYKLEIAFAAAGNIGQSVTYPNGFVELTLDNPQNLPGAPYVVDNRTPVSEMLFGDLDNNSGNYDGVDIFCHHEGTSPYWFIARSKNLRLPTPTLRWEIHRDLSGWDHYMWDSSGMGYIAQPAIIGSFESVDISGDDVLIKLRRVFTP